MEMSGKKVSRGFSANLLRTEGGRVLFLAAVFFVTAVLGGLHANAAVNTAGTVTLETETLTAEDLLPDSDELFAGYVEQLFSTDDSDPASTVSNAVQNSTAQSSSQAVSRQIYADRSIGADAGLLGTAGETHLDSVNLLIYKALKSAVQEIAAGEVSSTVVSLELNYTYEELGATDLNSAVNAFLAVYKQTYIFEYLLLDCPYELYWFDKTIGVSISNTFIGKQSTVTINLIWTFPVAEDYQGSSAYTVDASKVLIAEAAAAKAKEIVSEYAGKTDREKLTAYCEEICALVSYAEDYSSSSYGDEWELIYVFDGDDTTNVVCEGYAKAFQYLCDLSSFDDAVCYTVEGIMSGGTGAGGHMWNLIDLDGIIYMADVTNSDTDTIGEDGGLFLVCADDATASSASGYSFTIGKTTITYVYDSVILDLYEESILTLGYKTSISGCTVTLGTTSYTYDGTAKKPSVTVKSQNGTTLTSGTDYTVAYANNTNAGTASVTVTGTGYYSGTQTVTFTINAQSISSYKVTLGTTSYTYDGSAKKPSVTVKNSAGTKTLTSGTDYTVAYSSNTNAGTATVTVTGTGNYTGTLTKTFTINKASQTVTATAGSTSIAVGGSATTVTASTTGNGTITFSSSDTSVAKVNSSTGVVTAVAPGTATITVTAASTTNYNAATATVSITVKPATCSVSSVSNSTSGMQVTWKQASGATGYYVYRKVSGGSYSLVKTITSGSTVTWSDTATFTGGKDYTYRVAAYFKKSDGTIIVGSFGATKTCKYLAQGVVESVTNTTSGQKVTWTKVSGANGYYVYRKVSGGDFSLVKTITSGSTVSWSDTSSHTSGKDYTYRVVPYFKNSSGVYTVGAAKTTKTTKYLTAGAISSFANTSSGLTVNWTKVTGASGYYVYRKTSSASSYTLVKTITSGSTVSYTDTAVKSNNNTCYTYYVQPYFKSSSGAITKASYTTRTTYRLVETSISSLTNSASKKMTVKWSTKSGVNGYQIQYSTSSSFSSGNTTVKVTGASSASKVISSLTKGKTYYVRVRTYKTVNGVTYYSAWCTKKSVTISK